MSLGDKRLRVGVAGAAAVVAGGVVFGVIQSVPANPPTAQAATVTNAAGDPATWSARRLAAELVLAGVSARSTSSAKSWAQKGIAGIVLFGSPPSKLRSALNAVRDRSPQRRLIVASDEEGGMVQRLSALTGRMPSAATIGRTKTPAQTRQLARTYGKRMKKLGVNSDLAPVADLLYPGSFTANDQRAFKSNPQANAKYVVAFMRGLQDAGVSATVKHWPGGGAVADTHVGAGRAPQWSVLQTRDLVPFKAAFSAGVASVMVGHARVPGLTGSLPSSQSPKAYRAVRQQAGDQIVVMTDSLAMAAVTKSLKQDQAEAAIRALKAGADLALIQDISPTYVINQIATAIRTGEINKTQAIASARRVLALQTHYR